MWPAAQSGVWQVFRVSNVVPRRIVAGAEYLSVIGRVFGVRWCHIQSMAQTTYDVFAQQDSSYAVTIRKSGTLARTATGFATEVEARAWVEMDQRLEDADNPFRERDPAAPRLPAWRAAAVKSGDV